MYKWFFGVVSHIFRLVGIGCWGLLVSEWFYQYKNKIFDIKRQLFLLLPPLFFCVFWLSMIFIKEMSSKYEKLIKKGFKGRL